MPDSIIKIENLAKRYIIGHQDGRDDGLRHRLERLFRAPLQCLRSGWRQASTREEFWALQNLNLEIQPGEVVGIIGRNGAGKSTLLKLLSRITEPTRGSIRLRGRVASLLEVGTGFHPELSGRENIFLNGAILGMSRAEIKRKFDDIVAFSGIERFLDTPVKRYSSGMYVRLAFAVAAHLEPEILIVDEVLAVGDAEFQRKCLAKMSDVAHAGRTILFVSHNMHAVTRLCSRCVLLHQGEVKLDGPADRVINAYLNSGLTTAAAREWPDPFAAPGDEVVRLCAVRIRSGHGEVADTIDIREPVALEMEYDVLVPGCQFVHHFHVRNEDGVLLFVAVDLDPLWKGRPRPAGRYISSARVPDNFFAEGLISLSAVLMSVKPEVVHGIAEDVVAFRVVDCLSAKDTARGEYDKAMPGLVRPLLEWRTQSLTSTGGSRADLRQLAPERTG